MRGWFGSIMVAIFLSGAGIAVTAVAIWAWPVAAGDGARPHVTKPKSGECVKDADFMRSNHMDILKHKRDLTMRQGIREGKDGLKNCVTCHAINDLKGEPIGIDDSRHFCRTCHDYAAVTIDCFQCHTSKPGGVAQ